MWQSTRHFVLVCTSLWLAAAALAAPLNAQGLASLPDDADALDGLKAIARAKWEALQRTPAERARLLEEIARAEFDERFKRHAAGRTTPDLVFESAPRLLEAKLGLLEADANPAPLYLWFWKQARQMEFVAEAENFTGKIAVSDVAGRRCVRLQAQMDWLAHRDLEGKTPSRPRPFPPDAAYLLGKAWNPARDQWEAMEADPRELAQARREAARETLRGRFLGLEAGSHTSYYVLVWAPQVLGAELALLGKDADPAPVLQRYWEMAQRIERMSYILIRAGRLNSYDLSTARCFRLEAEIEWLRACRAPGKAVAGNRCASLLPPDADPVEDKGRARAMFEASRADVQELLRQRLNAARDAYRDAVQWFQAGKVTPELPLDSSSRLLEAERAVAAHPKEEAAAVEKYWRRALDLEAIAVKDLQVGKISNADVMEVRYARLQAEGWMVEAIAKGEGK